MADNVQRQPRPFAGVGCTPLFGERALGIAGPLHVERRLDWGRLPQRLLHHAATLSGHPKFL